MISIRTPASAPVPSAGVTAHPDPATARERKEAGEGGASPADLPSKTVSLRNARVAALLLRGHSNASIRRALAVNVDVVRGVRQRLRACDADPYDVGAARG